MLELLASAVKGGFKTSEFWLAALAVVLPYASTAAEAKGGTVGVVGSMAVAAVYAGARAYVKGKAVQATAIPAADEKALELAGTPAAAAVRDSSSSSAGQFAPRQ